MGTQLGTRAAAQAPSATDVPVTARTHVPAPCGALAFEAASRRIFYRLWGMVPPRVQALGIRLGSPKITLGAVAVIQDARGRVLLAHHTYRRRAWGLPGGLVGRNEQPAVALARELREELDVPARIGSLLYADTDAATHHLTLYYRAAILAAPRQDGIEIDAYRYAPPDEVPALLGPCATGWLARITTRKAS